MNNRKYIIIGITAAFLSVIFYKMTPYIFLDSQQEKALYNIIDRDILINKAYNEDNSVLENNIDGFINKNKTTIIVDNSHKYHSDSNKSDSITFDFDLRHRTEMRYHGPEGSFSTTQFITILDKNLNIDVPNVKYPANLQLSDLVSVNSFRVSVNLSIGDSLRITPLNSGFSSYSEPFNSGGSTFSNFRIAKQCLNIKVDSKSINWGQLFLYILALSIIDLAVYYLLPKLGYQSSADKNAIQNIEEIIDYFKYDLINGELKTTELYNRSTLMLISGILVAVGGILVFTLSLEDMTHFINKETNQIDWKLYLVRSLRPSLILVFIEFIAIYLFKQYRALIDDYKYFYSINLIRLDNVILYKIIREEKIDDISKKKLIDVFNLRTDKINWVSHNDKLKNTSGAKELKENIANFQSLIKLIKG